MLAAVTSSPAVARCGAASTSPRLAPSSGRACFRLAPLLKSSRTARRPGASAHEGADRDPLRREGLGQAVEGHGEPPPADGEGREFNMANVAEHTGGVHHDAPHTVRAAPAAPPSASPPGDAPGGGTGGSAPASSSSAPPQDGTYHYTETWADVKRDEHVDDSWMSIEEPEALEAAHHMPAGQAAPHHHEMYHGEPEEGVGYKEPGEDIASALPGRHDETGGYV